MMQLAFGGHGGVGPPASVAGWITVPTCSIPESVTRVTRTPELLVTPADGRAQLVTGTASRLSGAHHSRAWWSLSASDWA